MVNFHIHTKYEYFDLYLETKKILEIPKMNFNGQPNMFNKIISYTCHLHLKLTILNPLNLFFCQIVKKMNPFSLQPFLSKF
jgi:hypothetical protein